MDWELFWTPEWVGTLIATATAAGAAGAYIRGRIEESRRSMPIFRCSWSQHAFAQNAKIEVINRLNEDLVLHSVESKSGFRIKELQEGSPLDEAKFDYIKKASPLALGQRVDALSSTKLTLILDGGESPRWLRFTISSSAKTLTRKRYVIRANQNE